MLASWVVGDVTIKTISVVLLLSCTAFLPSTVRFVHPGVGSDKRDLHPSSVYTSGHGGRWHEARALRRIPGV